MWNGTGTFRAEFSRKIRNGPRFKMRWNLFHFVLFFELVWNVSAIPGGTERNWQPCTHHTHTHTHTHTWSANWISIVLQRVFRSLDYIYYIASFSETKEKWEFYGTVVDCFYLQSLSKNKINHILKLHLIV